MEKELLIFSDESKQKRFESLCAISMLPEHYKALSKELRSILRKNNIKELKFSEVRTHGPKLEAAKEFIKVAIDFAASRKIRIDVIIWDLHDERHAIPGRDDKENLERMYYHLLKHIAVTWKIFNCHFYPDEQSEYDYIKIISYLNLTKYPKSKPETLPKILEMFDKEKISFNFNKVIPKNSRNNPIIQLADLFAGFSCFSRERSANFREFVTKNTPNLPIFEASSEKESETLKSRFEIISLIKKTCEQNGISISLNTNGYLKSYDKSQPVNIWHYEPQGEYDKAPRKK